jgi:hypothetical protein
MADGEMVFIFMEFSSKLAAVKPQNALLQVTCRVTV